MPALELQSCVRSVWELSGKLGRGKRAWSNVASHPRPSFPAPGARRRRSAAEQRSLLAPALCAPRHAAPCGLACRGAAAAAPTQPGAAGGRVPGRHQRALGAGGGAPPEDGGASRGAPAHAEEPARGPHTRQRHRAARHRRGSADIHCTLLPGRDVGASRPPARHMPHASVLRLPRAPPNDARARTQIDTSLSGDELKLEGPQTVNVALSDQVRGVCAAWARQALAAGRGAHFI